MNKKDEINLIKSDKSRIRNSKKKDYNFINHNTVNKSLITIINNNLPKSNKKINKILLIGDNSNYIYDQLNQIFPDARYYITNASENILHFMKNEHSSREKDLVRKLDIFNGRSLFNFTLKFNKFDLVIISNLYNHIENKEKVRNSARFIYKHLVKKKGLLCIIPSIRDLESNRISFLKNLKVPLVNNLEIKKFKNPLNLTLYIKN
ncbi:MAG: class I SAM-dependent methyltransferase [Promethearchaeota archaeon]